MKRAISLITVLMMVIVFMVGCAGLTEPQQRAVTGGAAGATGGAILGAIVGGSPAVGAGVGGAVGALGGYILGKTR